DTRAAPRRPSPPTDTLSHVTPINATLETPMFTCLLLLAGLLLSLASASPRRRTLLRDGWHFHRGDVPDGASPGCDDASWREVSLPHDFSIEDLPPTDEPGHQRSGPFDSAAEGGGGVGYT